MNLRGDLNRLDQEESSFHKAVRQGYETLVSMAKGEAGLTNTTVALPVTTSNRVFDELKVDHPLLQKINFTDSKGSKSCECLFISRAKRLKQIRNGHLICTKYCM